MARLRRSWSAGIFAGQRRRAKIAKIQRHLVNPRPYSGDMARGWESKSVEAQQEDARQRTARGPSPTPRDLVSRERHRALELGRTRAQNDLARASAPAHRQMLESAIAELNRQIAELEEQGRV